MVKPFLMQVPNYFKTQRKRHGLSQKQLGRLLDKSQSQISELETREAVPNLSAALAYSLLFNEPISALIPPYCAEIQQLLTQRVEANAFLFSDKVILETIQHNLQIGTLTTPIMTPKPTRELTVISVFPSARGFSYCYFEHPGKLVAWANVVASDTEFDKKVADLIEQFKPDYLVCEENGCPSFKRRPRFKETLERLYRLSEQYPNTQLQRYPRLLVAGVFEALKAGTQFDIAELIVDWLPELKKRKPRKRKAWEGKLPRSYLFDAASFALAHYYVSNEDSK